MTVGGDVYITRVKNSSFDKPNFSVRTHPIYLIFFCLKEYVRMQDLKESFFKILTILAKKKNHKFSGSKNAPKKGVYSYKCMYIW